MKEQTLAFLEEQKVGHNGLKFDDLKGKDLWKKTDEVSAPHVKRLDPRHVFHKKRPSEDLETLKYRQENYRWYTKEGFDNFITILNQILQNLNINRRSFSDVLLDYWSSQPYYIANQHIGWEEYFFNYISRIMLASPNSVEVHIPYRRDNPEESPLLGNGSEQIDIWHKIIPVDRIEVMNKDLAIFRAADEIELKESKSTFKYNWYWVVDKGYWYKLLPVRRNKKLEYELEDWYYHDTGMDDKNILPVQKLPGVITQHPVEENCLYHESFINTYFEIATEYISRVSDEQASNMKSTYEVRIYKKMDCPECDGSGMERRSDASELSLKRSAHVCSSCNGKGKLSIISPFQDIVYDDKVSDDRQQPLKADDIISSYSPDIAVVRNNWETSEALCKKMMNSIGLNLIGNANESGEAKKIILQKQENIVNTIKDALFPFIERHAFFVDSLLNAERKDRSKPKLEINETIRIKDAAALQEEVKNSPNVLKYQKNVEYIQYRYKGNEDEVRRNVLMLQWAPCLIYDMTEIQAYVASGMITSQEFQKYKSAAVIFSKIDVGSLSDDGVIAAADAEFAIRYTPPIQ